MYSYGMSRFPLSQGVMDDIVAFEEQNRRHREDPRDQWITQREVVAHALSKGMPVILIARSLGISTNALRRRHANREQWQLARKVSEHRPELWSDIVLALGTVAEPDELEARDAI